MLFLCSILTSAVSATETSSVTLSTKAHIFEVLPGSDKWKSMSPKERYASCEVSNSEVKNMTTDALIETILNYPYFINIYAYDSIETGIAHVSEYFPGIAELETREDAATVLSTYQPNTRSATLTPDLQSMGIKTLSNHIATVKSSSISPRTSHSAVTTPNGTSVATLYGVDWSVHARESGISSLSEAISISNQYLATYPSAIIIRDPSPSYNCHSYAWYSTSPNQHWMNDPSAYITDGSYVARTAAVGNKVTYKTNGIYDHSGITISASSTPVTVSSKWGCLAVFSHDVDDCPYTGNGSAVIVNSWARS